MPFYEIKWTKFGTALVEADNEVEAFEELLFELDCDEAEVKGVLEERPEHFVLYNPVVLFNRE